MSVHADVIKKLEEVLELVKDLPQGYQYKVRELCACVETVVSMYDDIQRGIIPEIFQTKEDDCEQEESQKEIVDIIPEADIIDPNESSLNLGNFDLD
jgi:hypothetical protein